MFKITYQCKMSGRNNRGLYVQHVRGLMSHSTIRAFADDNQYSVLSVERVG